MMYHIMRGLITLLRACERDALIIIFFYKSSTNAMLNAVAENQQETEITGSDVKPQLTH
jgi:hypothetical protein